MLHVNADGAYLSGWRLRALAALLRAPGAGPLLARALARHVMLPVGRFVRAASRGEPAPPPMLEPEPFRTADERGPERGPRSAG